MPALVHVRAQLTRHVGNAYDDLGDAVCQLSTAMVNARPAVGRAASPEGGAASRALTYVDLHDHVQRMY